MCISISYRIAVYSNPNKKIEKCQITLRDLALLDERSGTSLFRPISFSRHKYIILQFFNLSTFQFFNLSTLKPFNYSPSLISFAVFNPSILQSFNFSSKERTGEVAKKILLKYRYY